MVGCVENKSLIEAIVLKPALTDQKNTIHGATFSWGVFCIAADTPLDVANNLAEFLIMPVR